MEVDRIRRDQRVVSGATLLPAMQKARDSVLSRVPGEVWTQILESVIEVPYVLDTNLPKDGCYWWSRDRYHERSTYTRSEIQREALRLVCKGWKDFTDQNKYRWLCFNEYASPKRQGANHLKDALEYALNVRNDTDTANWNIVAPRRLTIAIDSPESKELFCKTINYISSKLTILFIDGVQTHGSLVFDHLIGHSEAMPCMRCLMLSWVNFTGTPLQQISRAFPRLTGLTFVHGFLPHNSDDVLSLPHLESLYVGKMKLSGMRPERWYTPSLLRLLLPINDNEPPSTTFRFVKALGAKLVLLRMDTNLQHVQIQDNIWKYCPQLAEMVIRLSAMEFLIPVPTRHPLRWVINKDPDSARMSTIPRQIFEKNLIALGSGIEAVILTGFNWTHSADTFEGSYFRRIAKELKEKGVRLEDTKGKTLDSHLAAQAAKTTSPECFALGVDVNIS